MRSQAVALLSAIVLIASAPSAFADDGAESTSQASEMKIQLLADFVAGGESADGVSTTAVTDMRTTGIGWGALFKIYKLAAAMDVDPSTLVGEIGPDGEFEFSFGELKKALTDEQREAFDAMPKNFGSLQASAMRPDRAAEKADHKAERDERKADHKAERDERKAQRDARKDARDAAKAERSGGSDDGDDDPSED
jgi:hypothetical protein